MIGLLLAWLVLANPLDPTLVSLPARTNLVWRPSPTPGVTGYVAVVSNWNTPKGFTNTVGLNTNWPGILTNRQPTFAAVIAQAPGTQAAAVTNFFVPTIYLYSIYAQTGSLAAGFNDWKLLGAISGTNSDMLFRLRVSVVASNAVTGVR